jgi:four helix bundle protein
MDQNKQLRNHQKMIVWQNIDTLDKIVQNILKKIPKHEYATRSQIDNCSDSMGANFVEGYYSGSLGEYIRFLRYSKRSNGELQERTRRILRIRKGYIKQNEYDKFEDKAIKTMYLIDRLIQSLERKQAGKEKTSPPPSWPS